MQRLRLKADGRIVELRDGQEFPLAPTMPDGFLLGAGTVTDAETVKRVVDAGARFVVCPVFRRTVRRPGSGLA